MNLVGSLPPQSVITFHRIVINQVQLKCFSSLSSIRVFPSIMRSLTDAISNVIASFQPHRRSRLSKGSNKQYEGESFKCTQIMICCI